MIEALNTIFVTVMANIQAKPVVHKTTDYRNSVCRYFILRYI